MSETICQNFCRFQITLAVCILPCTNGQDVKLRSWVNYNMYSFNFIVLFISSTYLVLQWKLVSFQADSLIWLNPVQFTSYYHHTQGGVLMFKDTDFCRPPPFTRLGTGTVRVQTVAEFSTVCCYLLELLEHSWLRWWPPYSIYNIQYKMFIKLYTLCTSLFFGFG